MFFGLFNNVIHFQKAKNALWQVMGKYLVIRAQKEKRCVG